MSLDLRIEPGQHWWEASALTTVPSLHPLEFPHKIHESSYTLENNKLNYYFTEARPSAESLDSYVRIHKAY